MLVRLAKPTDIDAMVQVYADYTGEALKGLDTILDKVKVKQSLMRLIQENSVFIALHDDKIIGGMAGKLTPGLFSNDTYFVSLFFYFKPDYRRYVIPFLKYLEGLLLKTNITRMVIGSPELKDADKMMRFYQHLGYRKLETYFYKAV